MALLCALELRDTTDDDYRRARLVSLLYTRDDRSRFRPGAGSTERGLKETSSKKDRKTHELGTTEQESRLRSAGTTGKKYQGRVTPRDCQLLSARGDTTEPQLARSLYYIYIYLLSIPFIDFDRIMKRESWMYGGRL